MTTIDIQKQDLRREMANIRGNLPDKTRNARSIQLANLAASTYLEDWRGFVVSAYLPLGSELDPCPLLNLLNKAGITTALPRVAHKASPLVFHAWSAGDPYQIGSLKAPEPLASSPEVTPDIVLLPLLAFDKHGHRLGWGGGYYDRSIAALKELNKNISTIGLAFACQEVKLVPTNNYDQSLDAVLTELRQTNFITRE